MHTQREIHTHTSIQCDRNNGTQTHTERHTGRQALRQTRWRNGIQEHKYNHSYKHTAWLADRLTDIHTYRQNRTYRLQERHSHIHTHTYILADIQSYGEPCRNTYAYTNGQVANIYGYIQAYTHTETGWHSYIQKPTYIHTYMHA